jgi:6-pyruvoyltetrahydropterin/6-carboxytetrahydropterin synthase
MVMNMTDMKRIVNERVIDWVDHRHLNYDVPWLEGVIPTTEMLVVKFWERLVDSFPAQSLYEVILHETESNTASYRGEREIYTKEGVA